MRPTRSGLIILIPLIWVSLIQAQEARTIELTQSERDWLAANPEIRIGSDASWRPYVWRREDGTLAGVEVDLVARINALAGTNIRLVLGNWNEILAQASRGELHGLAVSARHAERATRFLFSDSPYSAYKYIFTRENSEISGMEDLAGRTVGMLRENLAEAKLLRRWPGIQPVEMDTPVELAVALKNGSLDAAISSANLFWAVGESMLPGIRMAFPVPDSKVELRYSILKEHAPLVGIVDKALAAIDPDVMMGILRNWGAEQRPNIELNADERAWLGKKHSVRVRIGEHPPWEIDRPEPQGMAVDYLRIIGDMFGIDFRFVPARESWVEGFQDMAGEHRRYDLLPAAKRTDERLAGLAMSKDYLSSPWAIFTRKGTRDVRNLQDLRSRNVAVERGYVMHDLLSTKEPAINLLVQDGTRDALLALSTGNADAYVGNLIVTDYLMQTYGIDNLEVAGATPFGTHDQAMVTRKEWAPLISLIDKGLKAMPAEQHIAIRNHWLPSVAGGERQVLMDLTDEERAWIAANPTIRVGAYALAPYIQEEKGRVDGYLVELLQAIAGQAGLRTDFRFLPLDEVLDGVQRGELEGTMAVSHTKEREEVFCLSQETVDFTLGIFARKEARDIEDVESLAGKTLATFEGYSWNALYPKYLPDTRIVTAADVEEMFRMVADGRADAAINESESGKALLRRYLFTNLEPKADAIFAGKRTYQGHYYGVSRRLPLLASILDKSFAQMPAAEKQRIWDRWFTHAAKPGEVESSPNERAYLEATDFRRARAMDWMPFDFSDADGTAIGIAEDYWGLIRDKLGLKEVILERQPFRAILADLEEGKADLYVATTRTRDREGYAVFSDAYESYPIAIATARHAGLISSTSSLEGRTVAVGRNYSAYHLLKERYPGIQFQLVDSTRQALERVAAGTAYAAVDILPVLHQQIERFPDEGVKLAGVTDVQFPLQVMAGSQHTRLIPLINRAIAAIRPEERAAIHKKWMMRQVVTAPDYSLLWQVLVTGSLILLIMLYWNRKLGREVRLRERTEAELLQAKESADSASRAKSEFLANVSHDLRTPLNAVLGFAQLLEGNARLDADQRRQVAGIHRGGERLLGLIDEVLDLAKIEADRIELIPVAWNSAELLQELQAMFRACADQKGIELHIERLEALPERLSCDAKRLHQILANLLDNAVKYTERGSVTLRAGFAEANLTLEVTDTGIGIPEGEIQHIFEPFHQVGHAGRLSQGTGLGLAITKGLIERMGGVISVESTLGRGTSFRAWIPAQPVSIPDREGATKLSFAGVVGYRRTQGRDPLRIIVADDEPENRSILRGLLESLGFVVQEAADGSICIEKAVDWEPDFICLDLRMPVVDGLDTARALREIPKLRHVPILAVTAAAFGQDRSETLRAGCDAHLAKPVLRDDLIRTLGTLLPLEWTYGKGQEKEESEPGIHTLPPDYWERLVRLVRTGSVTAIAALAQELAREDCCPGLARKIASLADTFDLAELRRLTEGLDPKAGTEPETGQT